MKDFLVVLILCLFITKYIFAKCIVWESIASCDSFDVPQNVQNTSSFLQISNESIKELPPHLVQFSKFDKISIQGCTLKRIPINSFVGFKVSYLSLMENEIEYVEIGAFKNLTNLDKLTLKKNKLKTIQRGVFTKLPLKVLTLSANKISAIEDSALEDLPHLTKLHLNNNELKKIFVHKIITNPSQLEILWLHNNALSLVTNHMLRGLTNLKILNLGFNKIQRVEEGTFEQTPHLQTLVLSANQLKEIDGGIFPTIGSNSLEKVYLDNNQLMFLSSSFFFKLNKLKKFTLVGNPWLCRCLESIWRILYENEISEKCQFEYGSGAKPACISDDSPTCSYKYNTELSTRYLLAINSGSSFTKHLCIL